MQKKIKARFVTLGCRLNQLETESIAASFEKQGFECSLESPNLSTGQDTQTKLVVLNTCAVTAKAAQKARHTLSLLLRLFVNSIIIVTGCLAQLEKDTLLVDKRVIVLKGQKKTLLLDAPRFIVWQISQLEQNKQKDLQNENLFYLQEPLKKFLQESAQGVQDPFAFFTVHFLQHSRASLKIQDGCSNACSFCCVHLARGLPQSLKADLLVQRAKELEAAGQKEIVLTGVNLSLYQSQYQNKTIDFADVLELCLKNTKQVYFAISSLYPQAISDKLCNIIKDKRVQPRFHLSVQSGSDLVLQKMGRPYTQKQVLQAVKLLRLAKNNPFISCDIIAGFPGETKEDFEKTLELCQKAKFSFVHAFAFSARPSTPAASFVPKVPNDIVKKRIEQLSLFSKKALLAYINSCKGQVYSCVIEKTRADRLQKNKTLVLHAVTQNFLHILIQNAPTSAKTGDLLNVAIKEPCLKNIEKGAKPYATGEYVAGGAVG